MKIESPVTLGANVRWARILDTATDFISDIECMFDVPVEICYWYDKAAP